MHVGVMITVATWQLPVFLLQQHYHRDWSERASSDAPHRACWPTKHPVVVYCHCTCSTIPRMQSGTQCNGTTGMQAHTKERHCTACRQEDRQEVSSCTTLQCIKLFRIRRSDVTRAAFLEGRVHLQGQHQLLQAWLLAYCDTVTD